MSTTQRHRRTLLPWMGGKSKSAAHIIARLPEHTTYVEPFCGGCAVFLRKPRSNAEVMPAAAWALFLIRVRARCALPAPLAEFVDGILDGPGE